MARTFTREQFHDLVWSRPTVQLAKEFGLSDVALGKICRKHDVPKPPLGWWARKAAGRSVRVTPLPRAKAGTSDTIVIAGGETRSELDPLAQAREAARILASDVAADGEPPGDDIVARTAARLRRCKPEPPSPLVTVEGSGMIKASLSPASVDRFELALNRLAVALAAIGARFDKGEKSAAILFDGERIGFSVTEATRREKHVLTEQELAEDEARRRRSSRLRNPWDDEIDFAASFLRRPEWDYHPTGRLSFELEASYLPGSPRKTFGDAKIQRLETLGPDIAVGVAVVAAATKLGRAQREEEARRREEARSRRDELLRARHVAERRAKAMDAILEEVASLDRLGRLVEGLRAQLGHDADGRVAAFLGAAERRLAEQGTALSVEGLERRFAEQRLFGGDDDHGFAPPAFYY